MLKFDSEPSTRVLLWDIDGTLIRIKRPNSSSPHKNVLLKRGHAFDPSVVGLSGRTDFEVFQELTKGELDRNVLSVAFKELDEESRRLDEISTLSNVATSKFDIVYYKFFNVGVFNKKDWYKNNALYWGILDSSESAAITADRNSQNLTGYGAANPVFVDAYELPIGIPVSDRTNNILLNEFTYDETTDTYTGYAFALYAYDIAATSASTYTGKTKVDVYEFQATPNSKYHKKLAATLRSRGEYITDSLGFHVDSTTVGYSQIATAQTNPFATFEITGATTGGTQFTYSVSLDKTKKNYIKNVLGTGAYDKDTYLFAEEVFDSTLKKGWAFGEIKGLHYEVLPINNWDHFKFQFQSPLMEQRLHHLQFQIKNNY